MQELGWTHLHYIWATHHHYDHVDGIEEIRRLNPDCKVVGPRGSDIPCLDATVEEEGSGGQQQFKSLTTKILELPGHTLDHIGYYIPDSGVVFSGDTLFAMGCGRLFEGTADQMFDSIAKLKSLPASTTVYAAHEYTQANAKFALHADPANEALEARSREIDQARRLSKPTVPFSLHEEMETNPFVRAETPEAFAKLRSAKDRF
eukprot:g678.t1